MKIEIHLNKMEIIAVTALLDHVITTVTPNGRKNKAIFSVMSLLNEQFQKKQKAIAGKQKKRYKITLLYHEADALEMFLLLTIALSDEQHFIQSTINVLNQKLA